MSTFGQKLEDGSWVIDGDPYARVGEAGWDKIQEGDITPIVWGDVAGRRQPLAIGEHRVEYAIVQQVAAIISTIGWHAHLCDFARSSGRPDVVFDFANTIPETKTRWTRWNEEDGNDHRCHVFGNLFLNIPDQYEFSPSGVGQVDFGNPSFYDEILGFSDGTYDQFFVDEYFGGQAGANDTWTHVVFTAEERSVCIVDGKIYIEVFYPIETEVDYEPDEGSGEFETDYFDAERSVLFCYDANFNFEENNFSSVPQPLWHDILDYDFQRVEDVIVTGGKVAVLFDGPYLFTLDADTGSNLQEVDLSSINFGNSISGTVSTRAAFSFALGGDDTRLWLADISGMMPTCVNLANAGSVAWSLSPDQNGTQVGYQPVGIAGGSWNFLKEVTSFEVVTDFEFAQFRSDAEPTPVDRPPAIARGHSQQSFRCSISLETGLELGTSLYSDTEAAGNVVEPITEYKTLIQDNTFFDLVAAQNPSVPTGPFSRYPANTSLGLLDTYLFFSYGNYYSGVLPDEAYQETNFSGTHIEGPIDPQNGYGDFQNAAVRLEHKGIGGGGFGWSEAYVDEALLNLNQSRLTGDPATPSVPPTMVSQLAVAEGARQTNGDWIRAEVFRSETQNQILDDQSAGSTAADNIVFNGSCEVSFDSARERGDPIPSPTVTVRDMPLPRIPHPKLDPGAFTESDREQWDEQFRTDYDAWVAGGQQGDPPHQLFTDAGWYSNDPDVVISNRFQHWVFWRPVETTVERQRSALPGLRFGPSFSDGEATYLGPAGTASGFSTMVWEAWDAVGRLKWKREVGKAAAVGDVVGFAVARDATGAVSERGVFTFYNDGVDNLIVLSTQDGSILHDAPVGLPSSIRDVIFGDDVLWSLNSNTGLETVTT